MKQTFAHKWLHALEEMPRWARLFLAFLLMWSAGALTVAIFLLIQVAPQRRAMTPTIPPTRLGEFPLVLQTEILPSPTSSATVIISSTPLPPTATLLLPTATLLPPSLTATMASSPTLQAASATPEACPHPSEWVLHTVAAGETLFAFQLGVESAVTVDEMLAANCLTDRLIYEGQKIWLPPGAVENAPSSEVAPTPYQGGLSRVAACPCQVTIREGWRLEQIAELLDSLPLGFRGADFMAVAGRGAPLPLRDFLAGAPPGASLEGYMLPGTYTVTNEMTAQAFVSMVLDAFGGATGGLWGDAATRGLTPYQTVTLASIINRESRAAEQQVLISSVFHNRLQAGQGLGATVTTQYALGQPGDWWPNVAGRVSTYDSPYNTNIYGGLPPSPIASPSLNALRAAVYPAETNYFYFTASCGGSGNAFAETFDQHLANSRCQ